MTGAVAWVVGLPSAGKSTFAENAAEALRREGLACCVLDGDTVRAALGGVFGYDEVGRGAFYRALAELAAVLARQGLLVLVAATASRRAFRAHARRIAPAFLEVFVDVDERERTRRDTKGLYARAREGTVADVPGAGSAFEAPLHPDVIAHGGHDMEAIEAFLIAARRIVSTPGERDDPSAGGQPE